MGKKPQSYKDHREAMALRMKRLREQRDLTQDEMAAGLQIKLDTYKKEEQRGALRGDLWKPFALIVGIEVDALFAASLEEELALAQTRPKSKRRRRKKIGKRRTA